MELTSSPQAFTFIVTYGRSGSTLLQNMLNSIPGYQVRGENNNALLFMARAWLQIRNSEQMAAMRKRGQDSNQTHPWFGAEKVFPEEVGKALADTFIRTVLKPDPGVRVSGFKEIRFHQDADHFWPYLNFIHEFFPNARFIFNTRDHDSVAKSGWWAELNPEDVKKTLTKAEKLYEGYQKAFPERCHAVHYDTYVKSPETLKSMFEFLGESYDEKLVETVMNTRLKHLQTQPKS